MASRAFTARVQCTTKLLRYSFAARPSAPTRTTCGSYRAFSGSIGLCDAGERSSASAEKHLSEPRDILGGPSWSVESLLPPNGQQLDPPISSQQLHHLLRLSALPLPKTPEDEKKMMDTLSAQLHFVGEVQRVDTSGVKPLSAIRDETMAAEKEQTIDLKALEDVLMGEKVIGKHYKRIQRVTPPESSKAEDWDLFGSAKRRERNFFVVESEQTQE
ncbi:hypothetical protein BS50DRAFT_84140 [Corynespora cassiicola Philippines]|uniref:Glutamyl-tRNA amidotransferase complex subunit Gta3 domain-containing protein n=1 Tax=Corynespora cassiicola Philippines TaxID=1448308 RepID=A0A2T2NDR0_CORCC|nr:hypothetical protein BS50DRAFT_84140 [Corynespora cassiicola Philippines]